MTLQLSVPPAAKDQRLTGLPIAIIGAGPVGLAAAAELLERGQSVVVLEAGASAGHAISQWGHTRFFSPWEYVVNDAAARLLERHGWEAPTAARNPSDAEFLRDYLTPLSRTPELATVIRYGATVTGVSKEGMDRTRSTGRSRAPFQLQLSECCGTRTLNARAVIDASGTYGQPNSILSSGLPVLDAAAGERILGALPDVLGADRERFAGRHTAVVGAGHSAANTLLKLAQLARAGDGTRITWVVRGARPTRIYGSVNDELEARGKLGTDLQALVRDGVITLVDSFEIDHASVAGGQLHLAGRRRGVGFSLEADQAVAATGFRPDLAPLRELRLAIDDVVEAPRALAGLIDPNLRSCGSVEPHGVAELSHPDANVFIVGMKSYGRAPTFLLLTGYEQVRSIADELAGNHEAARLVQLVLPETGVCSTDANGGCCA
jgi:thioredoxin reductase